MITIHRDYLLVHRGNKDHAHVKVNPVGHIDIELNSCQACYHSAFDDVHFEKTGQKTKLTGNDHSSSPWQVMLSDNDAKELNHLIEEANDVYETLMRDL
ncbi:hypothetical protein [Vibrio gazogenes]|uniref:Uncharacterized protein n=1 Tax=Vibrio gazogenes DSM 21264 = NBRC 103151 TaxID=1123492 RepID=A0A1M4YNN9_VIBGA|nr:hypothetical protein [Vibrio gazogenes]USP15046.1 hypothetical protein MKS89_07030 [Vibrio gazogenes]SHF07351.1 hypothetical protein SAMN02745781_01387 [Vibrio gazogenes DSM 21264] [Vibrio gazogenes DSM 21264 = NBRC 103151]SJN56504.1 hypothetical protein BQ6471_02077 [Vibrio gazogenes]